MISGIYKIESPSGKVYIGQSMNIPFRLKKYYNIESCKAQTKIYRSLKKYGVRSHKFTTLELCDIEQLNERERYYQDLYKSTGKEGLNLILTKTSDKSAIVSEETRQRQSLAHKTRTIYYTPDERTRAMVSKVHKGKKYGEETREKIRIARAKQIITPEHKQAISDNSGSARQILNTETGIYYRTIKDAAIAHGIRPNYLVCSLIGRNANNKQFIYA